jgi:hypothetical protein
MAKLEETRQRDLIEAELLTDRKEQRLMHTKRELKRWTKKELRRRVRLLEKLDREAATHVESVICMKSSHFTGMPPYVGWKGLGLALGQDYDMYAKKIEHLEKDKGEILMSWESLAAKLEECAGVIETLDKKNKELQAAWERVDEECTASNARINELASTLGNILTASNARINELASTLRNILSLSSKPNFTTLHEFVAAVKAAEKLLDAVDADSET